MSQWDTFGELQTLNKFEPSVVAVGLLQSFARIAVSRGTIINAVSLLSQVCRSQV